MSAPQLHWLPADEAWRSKLKAFAGNPDASWQEAVSLANARLDFVRTNNLDTVVRRRFGDTRPDELVTKPVRLAVLGSSTLAHLHGALRVGGLRRGLWLTTYENDYGQYLQELVDTDSALHRFAPTAVLFAFDAHHLVGDFDAGMDEAEAADAFAALCDRLRGQWRRAREAFRCPVLQQTVLPVFPPNLGGNEHRLPGSRAAVVARLNAELRRMAEAEGIDLVAVDARAAQDGVAAWHDPALWHRSKQEVAPTAAPVYGDLVARLLAAKQGRSAKCLVLDLDNTVWGGVVGDDGVEGIVLGQGSALGEAFVAFQHYARELGRRGIILAVCSKNDEANAFEPFDRHPEMVLKRADIASFVANWNDKAANIRLIAEELNIGLDSLVFVDDNPFERALVRRELPMVAIPEVPDDPGLFAHCLADAGYFESLAVTPEDRERSRQYQSNRQRAALRASTTDLPSYLRSLDMQLLWRRFDLLGLQRIEQLINKTNQFNLTTRRYTEDELRSLIQDPSAFGLQLRLVDRFGDNGIIAIIIGRRQNGGNLLIDTWLMSCRVLGRQVEATTLNLVASEAKRLSAARLVGEYLPTKKNGMVREHYAKLGFEVVETRADGFSRAVLDLAGFTPADTFIDVKEG